MWEKSYGLESNKLFVIQCNNCGSEAVRKDGNNVFCTECEYVGDIFESTFFNGTEESI